MTTVKQLYDLQELDLDLDSKKQALSKVISGIGESGALTDVRSALAQERAKLAEAEHLMKGLENDVEDSNAKATAAGEKLYGGTVKNPKELVSLKEQLEGYKRKIKELEDKILEVMTEIEALKSKIAVKAKETAVVEEEWSKGQGALQKEKENLEASIKDLETKRGNMTVGIEKSALKLYEDLRAKRQGKAVARAEQGMCQGCRIVLPMNKLQQIKAGHTLVQCGSCERILYLS